MKVRCSPPAPALMRTPKPGIVSSNSIWSDLPAGILRRAREAFVSFIFDPRWEDPGKMKSVFPNLPKSDCDTIDMWCIKVKSDLQTLVHPCLPKSWDLNVCPTCGDTTCRQPG